MRVSNQVLLSVTKWPSKTMLSWWWVLSSILEESVQEPWLMGLSLVMQQLQNATSVQVPFLRVSLSRLPAELVWLEKPQCLGRCHAVVIEGSRNGSMLNKQGSLPYSWKCGCSWCPSSYHQGNWWKTQQKTALEDALQWAYKIWNIEYKASILIYLKEDNYDIDLIKIRRDLHQIP